MKLTVHVSDQLYIQADNPEMRQNNGFFNLVRQQLTHLNPKFDTLQRLGKWTGNTPRYTIMWSHLDSVDRCFLVVPRGYEDRLRAEAALQHVDLEAIDKTVYPEIQTPIEPVAGAELFSYQEQAVSELLEHCHGCVEAPTGSGKTAMFMSLIPKLQTPTLILVHTKELLVQTRCRLEEWLGVRSGILGAGKADIQDITVGMIQTMARLDLRRTKLATRFGAVIVDECHHSPAMTWAEILNRMQARYRYGFTATAWRKDKLEFVIWDVIGPIRSKITKQEVVDAGRIIWPTVEQVTTDYFFQMNGPCSHEGERYPRRIGSCPEHPDGEADPSKWTMMVSDLVKNENRNRLLVDTIRKRISANKKGLVLTDRIEHANHLAGQLMDLEPALLTGELGKRDRNAAMARVRDGAKLTVATIHLLGEGVDVPGWDILFLVSPLSRGPRVMQALGRIARVAPGKTSAILIDFVDFRIPMLWKAAKARMRLYGGG